MASDGMVVPFPRGARRPRRTRYRPMLSTVDGSELMSAERSRELDAEVLCERLSQRFIGHIRLMSDDKLAILEALANGVFWTRDEQLDRLETAASKFAMRKRRAPRGHDDAG